MTDRMRIFRKSSYSGSDNDCVEVSITETDTAVRDTKDRNGGVLEFTPKQWSAFVSGLKA